MKIRRTILVCVLVGGLNTMTAIPARAEHTRTWRQSDSGEFEKGTAKGVAIRSDGKLMPAPRFTSFTDPNLAYLWTLRLDYKGRLYAAGGSDAKVLRFDDVGRPATVFRISRTGGASNHFRFARQSLRWHFARRQSVQSDP